MSHSAISILSIEYGNFDEVNRFNPGFTENGKKLRTVLYLDKNLLGLKDNFSIIYPSIKELFPESNNHKCLSKDQNLIDPHGHFKVSQVEQLPHLMEHLLINIQRSIGKMDDCHGITCVSKTHHSRFDIFIECIDPKLGEFATFCARSLLEDILVHGCPSALWEYLFKAANYLYPASRSSVSKRVLKESFGWSDEIASIVLKDLEILEFFHSQTGAA